MTVAGFLSLRWGPVEGPLIEPPRLSPIVADPTFLFPEETPSGMWELFAHSAWGVHRYSSTDGGGWTERGIVVHNALRPFVRKLDGETAGAGVRPPQGSENTDTGKPGPGYRLYFEAYPPLALPLTALPMHPRWKSWISVSASPDLERWSEPSVLVRPDLPWTRDETLGSSVSNPCLVRDWTGAWRLYYSASLAWIDDCGFCEPRYIALARGASPDGPFVPEPRPVLDPAADSLPRVLGAGAIKAIPLEDGWIGLQNKIYRDAEGRSRSALFILRSEDGLSWSSARETPLLAPGSGWTASHVYACDCRFRPGDGSWHLYFNARDGWRINEGRERIGRITAPA